MKTVTVNCSECKVDFQKPLCYITQGEKRGYPNHFCSNKCSVSFNQKRIQELKQKRTDCYYKTPKKCPQCQSIISYEKRHTNSQYCSSKCSAIYTQKNGGNCHWSDEGKEKLRKLAKKNPYFNGIIISQCIRKKVDKINKICPICIKNFQVYSNKNKQICCSKKCSKLWIIKTGYLKGKSGGYRERGGRGKQGWYKGYYCNSSWELAWVIYQLEHKLNFKRNTKGFEYQFENKKYKFYPDFILDNGEYVEVKGYTNDKTNSKFKYFPHKLNIVGKKDIIPFIQYAEQKYGKNYIKLYETKKA